MFQACMLYVYLQSACCKKNQNKTKQITDVSCSQVAAIQTIITTISLLRFPFSLTSEWLCTEGRENRQKSEQQKMKSGDKSLKSSFRICEVSHDLNLFTGSEHSLLRSLHTKLKILKYATRQ